MTEGATTARSSLKAYTVTTIWSEASVIVFATSPADAKAQAIGTDWLDDAVWVDLRARRQPSIDHAASVYGHGSLDFSLEGHARLARGLGWYELESCRAECVRCGMFPWTLIPESVLDDERVCRECATREPEQAAEA